MDTLRNSWDSILDEAKAVTSNSDVEVKVAGGCTAVSCKRARFHDETNDVDCSKLNVQQGLLDTGRAGLRFRAI